MFGRRAVVNIDDYSVYPKSFEIPATPTFTSDDEVLVNNQRLLVNFWVLPGPSSYRVYLNSDTASSSARKARGSEGIRKRLIDEVGAEYFPPDLLSDSLAALGVKKKVSPRKDALKVSLRSLEDAEEKQGPQEEAEAPEASDASEDESIGAADYEAGGDFDDGDADMDGDGDAREYGGIL